MADEFLRFVVCRNGRCGHSIMLPDSSQLGKFLILQPSDDDAYFEIFVCPVCVHVYDYTHKSVRDRLCQPQDRDHLRQLISELLNFDCAVENCGVRVTIQKPTRAVRGAKEFLDESKAWVLADVHCQSGHQITQIPENRWAALWPDDARKNPDEIQ